MSRFVWCKKEMRRLPFHRCVLCRDRCHDEEAFGELFQSELKELLESGKIKESYVVKRKEASQSRGQLSFTAANSSRAPKNPGGKAEKAEMAAPVEAAVEAKPEVEMEAIQPEPEVVEAPVPVEAPAQAVAAQAAPPVEAVKAVDPAAPEEAADDGPKRFILENGALNPVSMNEYTTSVLYEVEEAFEVTRRFTRPEDPKNITYEGRKPSKKTIPAILGRNGETVLLESWDQLEEDPSCLAGAEEVLGLSAGKMVFVLKRK